MNDPFFQIRKSVDRLVKNYKEHGNLFIAFDFDDTVFDYHKTGDKYPKIEYLLKSLKINKFKLILFTAREDEKLQEAIDYCKSRGYEPDYINESPVLKTRKPFYNILLDDKAGLREAYSILVLTLTELGYDYRD